MVWRLGTYNLHEIPFCCFNQISFIEVFFIKLSSHSSVWFPICLAFIFLLTITFFRFQQIAFHNRTPVSIQNSQLTKTRNKFLQSKISLGTIYKGWFGCCSFKLGILWLRVFFALLVPRYSYTAFTFRCHCILTILWKRTFQFSLREEATSVNFCAPHFQIQNRIPLCWLGTNLPQAVSAIRCQNAHSN